MIKKFCTSVLLLFLFAVAVAAQDSKPEPELYDEFGQIPGEDLLARIEIFAVRLLDNPSVSGLIVGYGPAGKGSGTAEFQVNSIKDFFVKELDIEPQRLLTINAGRLEKLTDSRIRFWLIPPGAELPKEQSYTGEAGTAKGKVADFVGYEYFGGIYGETWGPPLGLVRTAGIADALREQPNTVLYIAAFDFPNSLPGAWKRIAEGEVEKYESRGIVKDRLKIVYGGRKESEEEVTENPAGSRIELWLVSRDAPQPVPDAYQLDRVTMALQIGSYYAGWQPGEDQETRFVDAIAEVLTRDPLVRVQFAVDKGAAKPPNDDDNELSKVDFKMIAEAWRAKLQLAKGIIGSRIVVTEREIKDEWQDYIEVWLLPPGVEIPKEEDQP
jgi:hypothetical protein